MTDEGYHTPIIHVLGMWADVLYVVGRKTGETRGLFGVQTDIEAAEAEGSE